MLMFRLSGVFPLRLAERKFCALFFQPPQRLTRFVPDGHRPKLSEKPP
jgi:hypothetical protein